MIAGLHGHGCLLGTGQQLLGLGNVKPRLATSRRSRGRLISIRSMLHPRVPASVSTNCSTNPIHALPAGLYQTDHTVFVPIP